MAAAAFAVAESRSFEEKASLGISIAGGALQLAQNARLWNLSRSIKKLNSVLGDLFQQIDAVIEQASRKPAAELPGRVSEEKVREASQTLLTLHLVVEEVYRRCAEYQFTNCSRFGVALQLERLREYSDRLWAMHDWLHLAINPAEVEEKMRGGIAEIEKGDFVELR